MELAPVAKPDAAEAPGAPAASAEASGGGSGAGDTLVIHPYLWPALPLKAPALGKLKKLSQLLNKGDKEGAAFLQALESARSQLGAGESRRRRRLGREGSPSPAHLNMPLHASSFQACTLPMSPQHWSRPWSVTRL